MKYKELFNLTLITLFVITIILLIFSSPGLEKDGIVYKELIQIDTLGTNFWVSKKYLSICFASLFFFIFYIIRVIIQKFRNNIVNIFSIISNISLIVILNFIRKLGYFSMLTGHYRPYINNRFSKRKIWGEDTFLSKENIVIMGLQLILIILTLSIGILTIKRLIRINTMQNNSYK